MAYIMNYPHDWSVIMDFSYNGSVMGRFHVNLVVRTYTLLKVGSGLVLLSYILHGTVELSTLFNPIIFSKNIKERLHHTNALVSFYHSFRYIPETGHR